MVPRICHHIDARGAICVWIEQIRLWPASAMRSSKPCCAIIISTHSWGMLPWSPSRPARSRHVYPSN